jgi:hypothetical protein
VHVSRGAAVFCLVAGASIPALWVTLLALGRVTDLDERTIAYVFHWTAEGLTAGLLIAGGSAGLRAAAAARRLFFFAAGMLGIASFGMFVYYAILGNLLFVAMGAAVATLAVVFVRINRPGMAGLTRVVLGGVVYVLLTATGNALNGGDTLSAVYLLAALAVAAAFSLALLLRSD